MSTLCEWLTETRFSPACGLSRTFLAVLTCCGLSRCWCTAPRPVGQCGSLQRQLFCTASSGKLGRSRPLRDVPNLSRGSTPEFSHETVPCTVGKRQNRHSLGVSMKCALGSELVVTHGAVGSNRLLRRSSVIDSKRCTVFTVCDQRSSSLINGDSNSGGSAFGSNATAFQAKCMSSRTRTSQAGNRWFTACDSMARRANGCVRLVRSAYLNRPRIMMQSYEGARCFRRMSKSLVAFSTLSNRGAPAILRKVRLYTDKTIRRGLTEGGVMCIEKGVARLNQR